MLLDFLGFGLPGIWIFLDSLGLDQDVGSGLFFRIWIRFDRDTKMFNFAPLLFLIRPRDVFLRRLVRFNRFSDFLRIWILVACDLIQM